MSAILDGRTHAQKIEEALAFLKENGYVIRGPLLLKENVTTPAHVVRYFYDTLARYRPNSVTLYGGNTVRDRVLAKELIAARMKTGTSKKRAITESCEIIDLLFKHEERLGLSQTVASMVVLGQGKMVWITEKLLQIRENLDRSVVKEENAKYFQELYKKQAASIKQDVLNEARDKLDKVLEKNGKKEETSRED